MYERFTDRARRVILLASDEARRFRHEYIGTEHLLLGLIGEGSGIGANVLRNLDVDLAAVRRQVERIVQHGPDEDAAVAGRLPHTPRAKKVIDYAIEGARALGHNFVGTEHLLLGLLREGEGVAAQVLMNLGLNFDDARTEVLNLLGHNLSPKEPSPPAPVEPDVVKLDKTLPLDAFEGYPVSDFLPDETPPAPVPPSVDHLDSIRGLIRQLQGQMDPESGERAEALAVLLAWYQWSRGR